MLRNSSTREGRQAGSRARNTSTFRPPPRRKVPPFEGKSYRTNRRRTALPSRPDGSGEPSYGVLSGPFGSRPAGQPARAPGRLEVVAADRPVQVEQLPGEEQLRHPLAPQGP